MVSAGFGSRVEVECVEVGVVVVEEAKRRCQPPYPFLLLEYEKDAMFALKIFIALTVLAARNRVHASSSTKHLDSFKDLWTASSKTGKEVSILQLNAHIVDHCHH